MKYFKIKYPDGRQIIVKAETCMEVIKRYDLATKENINTRCIELSGEQLALAIANDQE